MNRQRNNCTQVNLSKLMGSLMNNCSPFEKSGSLGGKGETVSRISPENTWCGDPGSSWLSLVHLPPTGSPKLCSCLPGTGTSWPVYFPIRFAGIPMIPETFQLTYIQHRPSDCPTIAHGSVTPSPACHLTGMFQLLISRLQTQDQSTLPGKFVQISLIKPLMVPGCSREKPQSWGGGSSCKYQRNRK